MFLQLIVGRVGDHTSAPIRLRSQWERWENELAPGASGWLGSTAGVTTDGRVIMATQFASSDAARANAGRPEQRAWWTATEAVLRQPAVFLETEDIGVVLANDPSAARFVQVMRARVADRDRLEALEAEMGPAFFEWRPDFLAGYRAWFDDGASLAAVDCFRSEAEARAGESQEMPETLGPAFSEWMSLVGDAEWFDLTDPWLASPGR